MKKYYNPNNLKAISPIDGREYKYTKDLEGLLSEFGLMKYRTKVICLYFLELSKSGVIRKLTEKEKDLLISLFEKFDEKSFVEIKEIEETTNHDIKSVEYFIKGRVEKTSLKDLKEMIYFGLTADDVNNLAYALMFVDSLKKVYLPTAKNLLEKLANLIEESKSAKMLGRTHGQLASPTTMGKELAVFAQRLKKNLEDLLSIKIEGKLSGAVGSYNSFTSAFPDFDWINFSRKFVSSLGLEPNIFTTQIESYTGLLKAFQNLERTNLVLLNLCQDMWRYISDGYFKLRAKKEEVGSSAMPHKVNPIDFEIAEGNLEISNSLLSSFVNTMSITRLQRDLSDETAKRNIGVALAHALLGLRFVQAGLEKVDADKEKMLEDLKNNPQVIVEGLQSIMRSQFVDSPYEKMKELTRGKKVSLEEIHIYIKKLGLKKDLEKKLLVLKPENYTGLSEKLAELAVEDLRKFLEKINVKQL